MISTWYVTGPLAYERAHELQHQLVELVADGALPGVLLLLEHPEVVTLGRRRGARENVLDPTLPVLQVDRGGGATWHGPGQLVAYPIVPTRDPGAHLRAMEDAVIATLTPLGLSAVRDPRGSGVWLRGEEPLPLKVCSIGVAVRRWVSSHGLALNLHVDLSRFNAIRPCGADASVMTSLHLWLRRVPSRRELATPLTEALREALARPFTPPIFVDADELTALVCQGPP